VAFHWMLRKDTRLILPSKSPVNWKSLRGSATAKSIREWTNSLTTIQPQTIVRLVHQRGASLTILVIKCALNRRVMVSDPFSHKQSGARIPAQSRAPTSRLV
jgi:hypothetical protein